MKKKLNVHENAKGVRGEVLHDFRETYLPSEREVYCLLYLD